MPDLASNPLPIPGSFENQLDQGLIRFTKLAFDGSLIGTDQALLRNIIVAIGANAITNATHTGTAGDPITLTFLNGTTSSLALGGSPSGPAATVNLYWGATYPPTTLPTNLAQTDLDGFMTQTNINGDIMINIDTPATPARDDWSVFIVVTNPHRVTYINEGFGETTDNWTEFTAEDIGGTSYNGRYRVNTVGDGTFRLTIRIT